MKDDNNYGSGSNDDNSDKWDDFYDDAYNVDFCDYVYDDDFCDYDDVDKEDEHNVFNSNW